MVKYIIPGFYEHFDLNLRLIELMEQHKEWFFDNTCVYASYGNFQHCIFDGGRSFLNYRQATKEDVERITRAYNDLGVKVRFVFTNNQLKETDYYDRFANMILTECENGINEIVIADGGLETYIRERYPKYNFISSTTKCLSNPKDFKAEIGKDNYYMVCLDYNLNKNMKMLESLNEEERGKSEFLINAICSPGCPNRKDHYRLNSFYSLSYGKPYQMQQCMIFNGGVHPSTFQYKNNLTPQEIYEIYEPMGFSYFKIEGRTWHDNDLACTYATYMVKPEFHMEFITTILDK